MSTVETLFRFEQEQGYCVVSFLPSMNDAQLAAIDSVGGELLSRLDPIKQPALLVDLSQLNYIGSAMVALIVKLWKAVKTRNGRMVVQTNHEMVLEVLRIAGLQQIWTIVGTREEALKALGVARRGTSAGSAAAAPAAPTAGAAWAVVAGLLALLAAAAGLLLYFYQADLLQRTVLADKQALVLAVIGGALGLVFGTIAAVRGAGTHRTIGGIIVAGCLAVMIVAVVRLADSQPAPAPQVQFAVRHFLIV